VLDFWDAKVSTQSKPIAKGHIARERAISEIAIGLLGFARNSSKVAKDIPT